MPRLTVGWTIPRASRYWVLVGIINGQPQMAGPVDEWEWLVAALTANLSS